MGQSAIDKPMIVARSGPAVLLVSAENLSDPMADCQKWDKQDGYSDIKPLGVWLKFLYYLEEVNPPEPWHEPVNLD